MPTRQDAYTPKNPTKTSYSRSKKPSLVLTYYDDEGRKHVLTEKVDIDAHRAKATAERKERIAKRKSKLPPEKIFNYPN